MYRSEISRRIDASVATPTREGLTGGAARANEATPAAMDARRLRVVVSPDLLHTHHADVARIIGQAGRIGVRYPGRAAAARTGAAPELARDFDEAGFTHCDALGFHHERETRCLQRYF